MLEHAHRIGVECLALTDINNTSVSLDFVRLAKALNIKAVLGIDVRNGANQLYVALAKNKEGFSALNAYISQYLTTQKIPIPKLAPDFEDVFVIYPLSNAPNRNLKEYEFIGINKDDSKNFHFRKKAFPISKYVFLHAVSFSSKKDFNAHRILRAVANNLLLSKLPKTEEGKPDHKFLNSEELSEIKAQIPELIEKSNELLNQCYINFEFDAIDANNNQKSYTGNLDLDFRLIRKLCYDGLGYRYEKINDNIIQRIENELNIIREKGFVSYFLITWKILKYARSKGYFYVGRGSGANSIVSYLMRITDVDPIELDLYFERFINLFRKNPPDFDIDFSWKDREDVTKFIFRNFNHVSLLGAYVTYQFQAVIRELGKVFGLPDEDIKALQSKPHEADEIGKLILTYSQHIHGFPSHLSPHSAGILISEKSIHNFTATFTPPKGFPTTHFDMIVAEDAALFKWDILGQRGLAKIKDALKIIQRNRPEAPAIDIHDIKKFKTDEGVKKLIKNAEAIGCFYVESPAMRMLLGKLQVDDYLGLVAASSVIRPGVARSGMMREFIQRYRVPEKRKEANPIMLQIMPETYGVMVYQEDVIKVAHLFAGLSLAEADVLRRGMSGKFRSREEFLNVKTQFFKNASNKEHPTELISEVWRQIESFAGYAFAKGHSASYAVESYQSLFLKAYFPIEYMLATINNGGGFYNTEFYLHEAKMHGAIIYEPCVNRSDAACTLFGKELFIGLSFVGELTSDSIESIITERRNKGEFSSLIDFIERVQISLAQLIILIRIGAFNFTNEEKKQLLWKAHMHVNKKSTPNANLSLFKTETRKFELPKLAEHPLEDAFEQIEILGFSLISPFKLLADIPKNTSMAKEIPSFNGRIIRLIGYLVTVKRTSTKNRESMYFGNFIDENGDFIDTVHFPPIAKKFPFQGRACYEIYGKVIEDFGVFTVEVIAMKRLAYIQDPRYASLSITEKSRIPSNSQIDYQ